jgi:hypothetical protein
VYGDFLAAYPDVAAKLAELKAEGIPVVIGEFGPRSPADLADMHEVMEAATVERDAGPGFEVGPRRCERPGG